MSSVNARTLWQVRAYRRAHLLACPSRRGAGIPPEFVVGDAMKPARAQLGLSVLGFRPGGHGAAGPPSAPFEASIRRRGGRSVARQNGFWPRGPGAWEMSLETLADL